MRLYRIRTQIGTLSAIVLLLGVAACGDSRSTGTHRTVAAAHSAAAEAPPRVSGHATDRDNDADHNDDDAPALHFGRAASPADRRHVVALITRYFAAATAGNAAAGCHLLAPVIAESFAEEKHLSPQLTARKCAVELSKLFRTNHALLVEKRRTLRVIGVRVQGDHALAILDFPTIPEVRLIDARNTAGSWGLLELLDGGLL